eukprot:scaffold10339_cov41-Cyclotella_meneghiniana.AAC.14
MVQTRMAPSHGAEAPNISSSVAIMQLFVLTFCFSWLLQVCSSALRGLPHSHPPSQRKLLCQLRRHRPKHQYRYHWFKSRMKRKKKKSSRHPTQMLFGSTLTLLTSASTPCARALYGTFCFKLEDEAGKLHTIELKNSLYVPNLKRTLLCPQHWSQLDDNDGTYIKNDKHGCWLVWNKGKSKKFVPLDTKTNTPIFRSAPGSSNYRAFEAAYYAMDTAFANRQTDVTFNNLLRRRGEPDPDPAEFVATEYFNAPKSKEKQAILPMSI